MAFVTGMKGGQDASVVPDRAVAAVERFRVGECGATVRDRADLLQLRADVTDGQPAAVEREDLLVEPDEPALALADDLRLKAAVAVAWRVDRNLPCSVLNVFGVVPLRLLATRPGGSSCGS
jgi:hypothetical protein